MEIPTTTLTIVAYTTCSAINVVILTMRLTGDPGLNGATVLLIVAPDFRHDLANALEADALVIPAKHNNAL
jgi:hypothetical protein